jgi:DNA polymerase III subunit delta'
LAGIFRTRGHPPASAVIQRAVLAERAPHALLLSGPARVGKTTLALDLVAGLLCAEVDPADRPCRACVACRKVESGGHPDVHRLVPEGAGQQIRLGQVQELSAALALLPLEGRFRLAVIEQAQRLNPDAQNALLKTLEEPPAAVTLVLAADEPAGLLPTVISRCARLRLSPVAPSVIAQLLAEKTGLDALRGEALGRVSGGRVGLALDMAAQPELLQARDRLVRTLLDLLGADRRTSLAGSAALIADGAELAAGVASPGPAARPEPAAVEGDAASDEAAPDADAAPASRAGRSRRPPGKTAGRAAPAERRAAVGQVISVWRELARDLALAAQGARTELRQRDMIEEITRLAGSVDGGRMARFTERLDAAGRAVDAYANPELALDALLLDWAAARGGAVGGRAA